MRKQATIQVLPLVAALLLGRLGQAQAVLPVLEQTPASLPWYEVRTPHFRVLYPAGFEDRAQRTARRLEQVHGPAGATLEQTGRPVTVVLQSQNTIGNGFVALLPRRSEFYTTFPQDPFLVGTLDWLDQLTVHEYRHIVQYDKARQGLGRLAYTLFGYGGLGLTTLGVPDWFAEGDAVGTETALTRSGRGRIPNFDAAWRANLLAGRRYSYGEVTGGSFRRFVPNHYVLGYFLTTNLRRMAGPQVWSQALNRYYRFPVYPLSFSDKLRRTTGLRPDDLYRRTERELDSTWRAEQARLTPTPATDVPVAADKRIFTEYQYPQYLPNGALVALKSGLGHAPQLVLLRGGGKGAPAERRLLILGLHHNPEQLSAGGGKVAWLEFRYDPRWRQRVYSELRVLDVATGRLSRPGRRTRYTTAVLSPDGSRLLAVSTDSAYQHRLHLLDATTGAVLRTYENSQNQPYLHPRFGADGRTAAVVRLEEAGKSLALLDVETGQLRTVLPAANDNLSHPQPWQEWVLFNSPRSGLDQVYAVHASTGEVRQVTERPVGAYHAAVSPDGRHLALHEVRAEGSRLIEMPLDPAQWKPVPALGATPDRYAAPLVAQETAGIPARLLPTDSVAGPALAPRRYRRLLHAPNVFSWGLTQSATGNGLDLGLRSQDVLSTTQAVVGAGFDAAERTSRVFGDFSYQGLWPVLDLSVERGGRRVRGQFPSGDVGEDQWQYTRLSLGSRLPLVLTSSRMLTSLTVGGYYSQERTQGYELSQRPFTRVGRRGLQYLTGSLAFARTLRQSYRDVGPRWGQTLSAVWRDTPFGGTGLQARQWSVQGSVFLPGLGLHHNLRLRAGHQRQQQQEYRFGAAIFYPRSLPYISYNQMTTYGAEYRLPLADVHWNLGRVLYVQRLKAAVFYDGMRGSGFLRLPQSSYYASGFDVTAVFNPLRLRIPLEVGVRTVYNSLERRTQVQPVLVNIGF